MLNLTYQPKYGQILEFLQRYLFKINPSTGTRGRKSNLRKVFGLMQKIP